MFGPPSPLQSQYPSPILTNRLVSAKVMKEVTKRPTVGTGDGFSEGARSILQAAERLFGDQGFDAVSIQAIAERAGVCKANVIHHFGSKETLYLAVLRSVCQRAAPLLQTLVREGGDFSARLSNFAQAHLAYLFDHPGTTRLILRELLESDARRGQELAAQAVGENFTRLIGILREGQLRGEIRPQLDPAIAAALLVGADVFLFQARSLLRHLEGVDFADAPQRFSAGLTDILLHGLLAAQPNDTADASASQQSSESSDR